VAAPDRQLSAAFANRKRQREHLLGCARHLLQRRLRQFPQARAQLAEALELFTQ